MRILVVHPEARFYGGAERVLEYYSGAASQFDLQAAVAADSPLDRSLPPHMPRLHLPDHTRFSLKNFGSQVGAIRRFVKESRVDLVHAWAARDWPLTSLAGRLCGVPVIGTLHDDPESRYIRPARQRLMRWNARVGLDRIVCVSEALRQRCLASGYPARKLETIRNGLPPLAGDLGKPDRRPFDPRQVRVGYLGAFSESKGTDRLSVLFDHVWDAGVKNWELVLGGRADSGNSTWWAAIWRSMTDRPWGKQVRTVDWVESPPEFFDSIDLLIFPSRVFDCLPTVLIEAARSGVPALAADVGGASETLVPDQSGWLFGAADDAHGGAVLRQLLTNPDAVRRAGIAAREHARIRFTAARMVDDYLNLYRRLLRSRSGPVADEPDRSSKH